jgi:hypothetical protein
MSKGGCEAGIDTGLFEYINQASTLVYLFSYLQSLSWLVTNKQVALLPSFLRTSFYSSTFTLS